MLRPHDREDTELDEVRLAPKRFQEAVILFVLETMVGNGFGGDAAGFKDGHGRALSPVCERRLGCDERLFERLGRLRHRQ
jgi:hypothetical protein